MHTRMHARARMQRYVHTHTSRQIRVYAILIWVITDIVCLCTDILHTGLQYTYMHVMRPFDCVVRMLMLGMRPFGQHLSCIADEHACFLADVKSKMSKQKSDRLESLKAASNQAAAPHPEPVGKTNLEDSFKGVASRNPTSVPRPDLISRALDRCLDWHPALSKLQVPLVAEMQDLSYPFATGLGTHTRTHMCAHTHTYIYIYIQIYTHTHPHPGPHPHKHTRARVPMHVHTRPPTPHVVCTNAEPDFTRT